MAVVKRFMARLPGVSMDGLVHSDGEVLCCLCRPVARWWLDVVFLMPVERQTGHGHGHGQGQEQEWELTLVVQSQLRVHLKVEKGLYYGK